MIVFLRILYLATLLVAVVWPRYMFVNFGKGLSPYVLMMLALVGMACVVPVVSRQRMSAVLIGMARSPWTMAALLAYTAIRFIADVSGVSAGASIAVTMQYLLLDMGWVIVGMVCLVDPVARARFPIVLMVGGLIATAAGVGEYVTQQPLAVLSGLDHILADSGDTLTAINSASSDAGSFRIKAVFTHPIVYGQVMSLLAPVALHLLRFSRGITRLGGFALLMGVAFGLYACQSRSPLIVLGCCMTAYLMLYLLDVRSSLRMAGFVIFVVVGLTVSGFAIQAIQDSVSGTNTREVKSTQARQKQFLRAGSVLPDSPVLGYGSGQSGAYAGIEGRNNVITVDSNIIVEEVDGGYARLGAYAAMFVVLFLSGTFLAVREPVPERRSMEAAVTSWFLGIPIGLLVIASDDMMSYMYIAAGFIISGHALRAIEANAGDAEQDSPVLPVELNLWTPPERIAPRSRRSGAVRDLGPDRPGEDS